MAGAWLAMVHREFLDDLQHLMRHDPRTARRPLEVMRAILKNPFIGIGIGKPEPLNYLGADVWSRRITQEHRCVYRVRNQRAEFLQRGGLPLLKSDSNPQKNRALSRGARP